MNYYFLLEDEKSFIKVLPNWLEYMGFTNTRVVDIENVSENCYVLQSGQGVTQLITKILFQTIDTLIVKPGVIDELVVVLDSEEYNAAYRKNQVKTVIDNYISEHDLQIDFSYKIFVCNHCFETWLLGNRCLYPFEKPPEESDFYFYYNDYNVAENDPEKMLASVKLNETIAMYHFHYFHEMCRYNKVRYSKKKPNCVAQKDFFDRLVERIYETEHLNSFREFYEYFSSLTESTK